MGRMRGLAVVTLVGAMSAVPAWAASQSPAALVRDGVQNVLTIAADTSLDAETRRERLTEEIAGRFDVRGMSESILALSWKDASEAEKDRFVTLFTELLEHIYVSAIEGYTTETVTVGGESVRGNRASVIVVIQRDSGADIPLLFKLERRGEGWIAYDANIEGLSLVRHYREEFNQIARSRGMPGVIGHLEGLVEAARS